MGGLNRIDNGLIQILHIFVVFFLPLIADTTVVILAVESDQILHVSLLIISGHYNLMSFPLICPTQPACLILDVAGVRLAA